MKKYYYITILALLVVTLLQGYNVSLQYKEYTYKEIDKINSAQVRKSVDSPPGMLTEDHHHTVHEESQVCYSSHLRPKSLHL